MGLYDRGRPKKTDHEGIGNIPRSPGEYRIRDKDKKISYVGETNDLRRRAQEHKKTGKFGSDSTFEYKVANQSSSADRRRHEQRTIAKHNPYLNKSRGGEGRPAHNPFSVSEVKQEANHVTNMTASSKKPGGLLRIFKIIMIAVVVIAIVGVLFLIIGKLPFTKDTAMFFNDIGLIQERQVHNSENPIYSMNEGLWYDGVNCYSVIN